MKPCGGQCGYSGGIKSLNFRLGVLLACLVGMAGLGTFAADAPTFYAAWVKPWSERPITSPALDGVELKAVVSIVAGEADANRVADMTPAERLGLAYRIKVSATEVATNGVARSYLVSNTGNSSTTPRELSAAEFQKLGEALAALPSDDSQLPLAGRRVVVQTLENGKWTVRVYDGRKLPTEVKTLLDQLANPYDKLL